MIRIDLRISLQYQIFGSSADFLFNIHPAQTQRQIVASEQLTLTPDLAPTLYTEPISGNRTLRLQAEPGNLNVTYSATLELNHRRVDPTTLQEVPVRDLPPSVIPYLYPSRYCQSDRLYRLANAEFGDLPQGFDRVRAISDWVHEQITYTANSTNSNTSATDTLIDRVGVCRDFAHLMIALCRAVNVPARFVSGTDFGADTTLAPPDFHAYVEVYLGDSWYIFDPSRIAIPMGLVRIGTGRDAADAAFATIFGEIYSYAPFITCTAVTDERKGFVAPFRCAEALSTDRVEP